MMTAEQNERLTRVGPGTPMGEVLRRYWHAIAAEPELDEDPVRKVRLLGEDLTLFRSENGEYGLIGDRCSHRGVDLSYGIPDECGLRCPYHGWLFDKTGACIETPFDDRVHPNSRLKEKVGIKGYPVQALGGLIFAYLGPQPVPLLPRWDVVADPKFDHAVQIVELPCNWVQCMDNSADPMHFEYLHAALGNYTLKKQGKPPGMKFTRHLKIDFDRFKYGLMKRRLLEGASEDSHDWTVGHPLLFPNILAQGAASSPSLQIRTPVDDTHTLHLLYRTKERAPDAEPKRIEVVHDKLYSENGRVVPDNIPFQDMLAWIAQGPISDRTTENLAASDTGIALFRRLLNEALDAVARGEDPMGVVRDASENEPMISLPREEETLKPFDSQYKTLFNQIEERQSASAAE